jgi:hypothetical protein
MNHELGRADNQMAPTKHTLRVMQIIRQDLSGNHFPS